MVGEEEVKVPTKLPSPPKFMLLRQTDDIDQLHIFFLNCLSVSSAKLCLHSASYRKYFTINHLIDRSGACRVRVHCLPSIFSELIGATQGTFSDGN